MASSSVALAGATGNLGQPILSALLAANHRVTALSRIGGNSSKLSPHANLIIKEVDFSSADSITPALSGVEVVISCVATLAIGSQNPLIDASVAAGVRRFIPAEFGMDSQNALAVALPVCAPKAATQQYLGERSDCCPEFTWTSIANGLFLDWCLEMGLVADLKSRTAVLYDGGDVKFSATLLKDIASAVLGVIREQEKTTNRVVYVHSAAVTQNQLIKYAKDKDGNSWETTVKDISQVREESLARLARGGEAHVEAAMLGFSLCGCFSEEYGCDFTGRVDNDLLGVRQLDEEEIRALVVSLL